MNTANHQIILAPLHGFTEFSFRNVYAKHFNGVDLAISPFVSLSNGDKINPRRIKDLLHENNHSFPIIPQVLGNNPNLFIQMANALYDLLGYEEINWNLGCPIKKIANKKRGSGLLPYPILIDQILAEVIPAIKPKLSIKLRLGYQSTDEIYALLPILNKYPLKNICIHPRLGIQMYEGELYHSIFKDILKLTKHEIIFNGDLNTLTDFKAATINYPTINKWMIGRGIIHNPFLPQILKNDYNLTNEQAIAKFYTFINDLVDELLTHKKELHTLYKMKDFWKYLSLRFVNNESVFDIIAHTTSILELKAATDQVFSNESFNDWVS